MKMISFFLYFFQSQKAINEGKEVDNDLLATLTKQPPETIFIHASNSPVAKSLAIHDSQLLSRRLVAHFRKTSKKIEHYRQFKAEVSPNELRFVNQCATKIIQATSKYLNDPYANFILKGL